MEDEGVSKEWHELTGGFSFRYADVEWLIGAHRSAASYADYWAVDGDEHGLPDLPITVDGKCLEPLAHSILYTGYRPSFIILALENAEADSCVRTFYALQSPATLAWQACTIYWVVSGAKAAVEAVCPVRLFFGEPGISVSPTVVRKEETL